MFIELIDNNGTDYLRVMESYSVNEGGSSKRRRRTVRNIGPLSRYEDGKPDYLERLRQSFRDGKPIIESLVDLVEAKPIRRKIKVEYDLENENDCFSYPKNIGYFLLDALYDALGIYDVLNKHKSLTKIEYDLNGLAKLLVFGRVLNPCSKKETFEGRKDYAFDVTSSNKLIEIYRTLDPLDKKADTVQTRMNHKIKKHNRPEYGSLSL